MPLLKSVCHHAVALNSLLLVTDLQVLLVIRFPLESVCSAYLGGEVEPEV